MDGRRCVAFSNKREEKKIYRVEDDFYHKISVDYRINWMSINMN